MINKYLWIVLIEIGNKLTHIDLVYRIGFFVMAYMRYSFRLRNFWYWTQIIILVLTFSKKKKHSILIIFFLLDLVFFFLFCFQRHGTPVNEILSTFFLSIATNLLGVEKKFLYFHSKLIQKKKRNEKLWLFFPRRSSFSEFTILCHMLAINLNEYLNFHRCS